MNFPVGAYLLAFVGAFAATLASMPLWRAWSLRAGLVDDPGHRKGHDQPTSLAGGLAVFTGLVIPLLGAFVVVKAGWLGAETALSGRLEHGFERRAVQLAAIFAGALGMLVLGWLDDKHELRARTKFAGQFAIAALVAAAGVRITLFVPSVAFSYAVTILWIVTLANAMNFLDNMNGLCGGLGVIAAACLGAIAAIHGQYLVALLAFLVSGALLGFLPFNFPKASVFIGDSGAHLVGYLLAVLAILPHFYSAGSPRPLAVLSPLLVLAVPLGDLVCVVWIRARARMPFWIGDTNHISHRLVRRGLGKAKAVAVVWALGALGGLAAIALNW
ncbi:MAG: undecaprenyl/decaprenyl-phosphate alpha-N-acetylglucosaminyl 1-phosphate transferase [Verrucomicrobia bacterium]|nr:undecaprenyl/decaprenyl-phosphate alpha-N-acetylglucosaminyl 1-phosphate transferase [Verrucomicrobiota bacterium]